MPGSGNRPAPAAGITAPGIARPRQPGSQHRESPGPGSRDHSSGNRPAPAAGITAPGIARPRHPSAAALPGEPIRLRCTITGHGGQGMCSMTSEGFSNRNNPNSGNNAGKPSIIISQMGTQTHQAGPVPVLSSPEAARSLTRSQESLRARDTTATIHGLSHFSSHSCRFPTSCGRSSLRPGHEGRRQADTAHAATGGSVGRGGDEQGQDEQNWLCCPHPTQFHALSQSENVAPSYPAQPTLNDYVSSAANLLSAQNHRKMSRKTVAYK
ncbi:uncharacterized protein LOC121662079 [Corvus kubaryi]|uniref:uncharacterized protein LOC121662079 n=1 Tax=Corvus kubaryi TaxID=68294 RepID=UPI001C0592CD|nr:uncharacterized protein LOC121662079 [Corvus kubaryi]